MAYISSNINKESDTGGQRRIKSQVRERKRERAGGRERRGYPASASSPDSAPHSHLAATQCRPGNNLKYFIKPSVWPLVWLSVSSDRDAQVFCSTFCNSAERKQRSYQSPRQAPAMVTLRTGFESCLNWLLFCLTTETLLSSPRKVVKFARNTQRMLNDWIQVRDALLHQCAAPGPSPGVSTSCFEKSVRTPLISAPQQTAMTAADSGCITALKPAGGPWLEPASPEKRTHGKLF